jgi:hypothetical protein
MVASRPSPLSQRSHSLLAPTFAALTLALLVLLAAPTGADHGQTVTVDNATYSVQFDHGGDNEWWVEFEARASNGDGIFIGWARVEGEAGWHYMRFAANDYERQQQGWSKFIPDRNFHIPPGKRVQFSVGMTDGTTGQAVNNVDSCLFTHPAGVEQCGSTTTPPPTGDFNAPFTGFRGNEWWVQAKVGTSGPAIAKVDVRIAPDGPWKPLAKQTWGTSPPSWAGSYHFPQGSILQMRATATDGRTDLSSCRQWIPPSGQDAAIVPCPGTSTAFDATFSGVKGNDWWVQASVSGNQPIQNVDARINCSEEWRSLTKQSYGWAASFHVPAGSKVDFRAISTSGNMDFSGGYVWPQATPTSAC